MSFSRTASAGAGGAAGAGAAATPTARTKRAPATQRTTGTGPRLVLEDLVGLDGDHLAPPALARRRVHVHARDLRIGAVHVVAHREPHVPVRREVGTVRPPIRPLLGAGAAAGNDEYGEDESRPDDASAIHHSLLWDCSGGGDSAGP